MTETIYKAEELVAARAKDIAAQHRIARVFDWGILITALLPVLIEWLQNCFNVRGKEELKQRLKSPSWWDKYWVSVASRRAVRTKRPELGLSSSDERVVASVLGDALVEECQASPETMEALLDEADEENLPGWNDPANPWGA